MIDDRAVVSPEARLGADVEVGPFAVIGAEVEIGPGTRIGPHVVIEGPTKIGRNNRIFQFSSLGSDPQDKKFRGERAMLEIGDGNTIREFCSINRGTDAGGGTTRIGNDNWIMAYVHIAHDCRVGSNTVMANNATLAGHVSVGDHAILGGFTKVHQFCRIGVHSFCAMDVGLAMDLPPYVLAQGHLAVPKGVNTEGLRRHGYSSDHIRRIRNAYNILYRSNLKLAEALERLEAMRDEQPELTPLIEFLRASERGIIR